MPEVEPSDALDLDTKQFFLSLSRATSVAHIATYENLIACDIGEETSIVNETRFMEFDYVLVQEESNTIGLLEARKYRGESNDLVSRVYSPISEKNLISEEAGVLEFILKADKAPARLVLVGDQIKGIVTIADLQKLPVRTAMFAMIMHLELLMTKELRKRVGGEDSPINLLKSSKRRHNCREKYEKLVDADLCIDEFGAMEFCDKRDLLSQHCSEFGMTRNKMTAQLKKIQSARDSLAHGGDYALTRDTTNRFICAAQACHEWIARLSGIQQIYSANT